MVERFDVAVIGGGIAGVTAAAAAAPDRSVVLLEQERELAHHTTSRSAAMFMEHEGQPVVHRLASASRPFFETDHPELDAPLLEPLPVLQVGTVENREAFLATAAASTTGVLRLVDGDELTAICPALRPDVAVIGLFEPAAASLDVMALHQLFVRRARAAGADVHRAAQVTAIDRHDGSWRLTTAAGVVNAAVIVNAAGAWGDVVAEMAGVEPVGLVPMRRTAFTAPTTVDTTGWPFLYAPISHLHCYLKPEAGNQLLCSLSDETPSAPCDARPEEIDIALALDHINALTTLELRSVARSWAGLRTFAPDRDPVFGWDDRADDFLWLVGQGGCGIITSPAAGSVVAALLDHRPFPSALGVTEDELAPRR